MDEIKRLWDYLKIQDDEILIVQSFSHERNRDEFIVAKMNNGEMKIMVEEKFPELNDDEPFRFVQQIDSDRKHKIPSVDQLKQDEQIDY